jgi:nucleoid-associated protein YgaU
VALSLYSRYRDLPAVSVDGRVSLTQRPPASATLPPDSIIHTVIGRETLDLLAYRYYGREDLWWRIADANRGIDAFALRPGQTLAIPPLRIATRTRGG